MNATLDRTARRAEHLARTRRQDRTDGRLSARHIERLVWRAVIDAGTEAGRDREEREELTARLGIAAAEWLEDRRRERPALRASDIDDLAAHLAEITEATRRAYRREQGFTFDPAAGMGELLAAAEQKARRHARRQNLPLGELGIDPAPQWARAVLDQWAGKSAALRAAALAALLPDVTAAEWASVETDACSPEAWQKRVERGTETLEAQPATCATIAAALAAAEPGRGADPERYLAALLGANPDGSRGWSGQRCCLNDPAWRVEPAAHAPVTIKRRARKAAA